MIPRIFRGYFRIMKVFSFVICFVLLGNHVCDSLTSTTPYTTENCFNEMVRRSAAYILAYSGQEDANSSLITCPGDYPSVIGNVLETISVNSTSSPEFYSATCLTYINYLGNDVTGRLTDGTLKYSSDSCIEVTVGAWLNYVDRKSVNNRQLDECHSELFRKWILNLNEENAFSDINGNTNQCMDTLSAQWIEFLTLALTSSTTETPTTTDGPVTVNTDSPVAINTDSPLTFNTDSPVTVNTDSPLTFNTDIPVTVNTDSPVTGNTDIPVTVNTDSPVTVNTDIPVTVNTDSPVTVNTDTPVTVNTDNPPSVNTNIPVTVNTDNPSSVNTDSLVTVNTDSPVTVNTNSPETVNTDSPVTVNTDSPVTVNFTNSSNQGTTLSSISSLAISTTPYTTDTCFNEMVRRLAAYILAYSGQEDANSSLITCPGDYPSVIGNVLETISVNSTSSPEFYSATCLTYINYLGNDVTGRLTDGTLKYSSDSCIEVTVGAWLNYVDRKSVNNRQLDECHSELFRKWILNLNEENAFSDINGNTNQCMDTLSAQWIEFLTLALTSSTTETPTTTDGPVTVNTDSPVAINTDSPLTFNTDSPVTVNTDSPLTFNTDIPVTVNTDSPVTGNTDIPVTVNTDSPVTVNTDIPVTVNTDSPVTVNTDTPVTVNTDNPPSVNTNIPVTVNTDNPSSVNTDSLVTVNTDSPVTVNTNSPETVNTDSPVTVNTDSPVTVNFTNSSNQGTTLSSISSLAISTTPYTTDTCFNEMVRRLAAYILELSGQEDASSSIITCPGDFPSYMGNVLEDISMNSTVSSEYINEPCFLGYLNFLKNDLTRRIDANTLQYNSDSCNEVTVGTWLNLIHVWSVIDSPLIECQTYIFRKWLLNLNEKNAFSDINGKTNQCMDTLYAQWIAFLTLSPTSSTTETPTSTSSTSAPQLQEEGCFNEIVRRSSAYILSSSGQEDAASSIVTCPGNFPSVMATFLESKSINSSEGSEYIAPNCVEYYVNFLVSDVSNRINNNFMYYTSDSCIEATVGTWLGLVNVLSTASASFDQCHLDLFAKWIDDVKGEIMTSSGNSTDDQCLQQTLNEWMDYLNPTLTSPTTNVWTTDDVSFNMTDSNITSTNGSTPSGPIPFPTLSLTSSITETPTSTSSTSAPQLPEEGCFNEIVRRSSAYILSSSGQEDAASSIVTCPGNFPSVMATFLESKSINSSEGSEYIAPNCVEYYVNFLVSDVTNRINNNFMYYTTDSCIEATVGTWLGLVNVLSTASASFDQCHLDLFAKWIDDVKGEIMTLSGNSTDDQCLQQTLNEWMDYLNPTLTSPTTNVWTTDDVSFNMTDSNITSTNGSTPSGPIPFPTEFCLEDIVINFSDHILLLLNEEDSPFSEWTCPGNFSSLTVGLLDNVTAQEPTDVSGNMSSYENQTEPIDQINCLPLLTTFLDNSIKTEMTSNSSLNVSYTCMQMLLRSSLLRVENKTAEGVEFTECFTERFPKWLLYLQGATVEKDKENKTDTDLCVISVTNRWIQNILTPPIETTTEAMTSETPSFNMSSSAMPSSAMPSSAIPSSTVASSSTSDSPEECEVEPCQNGGLFCPNGSNIFVCNCLGSFYGEFCEQIDVEGAAEDIENLDFSATGSVSVVENVMDTLISSAINVDNIAALGDVTNTIANIVDKLSTASLSEDELKSVGTTLLVGSGSLLSSLTSTQSNDSCGESEICEGAQETAKVMDKVLGNTVNLGSVVLKDMTEGSFEVKSETMNLTFNKADTESLTSSTQGADVALPSSLRDRVGRTGMMLAKIDINKNIYSLARTKENVTSAVKRLNLVTQSGGEVAELDPDDPVVIEVDADSNEPFSPLTLTTEGSTLTAVQEIKLDRTTPITIAEFEVPSGKKLLCRGRFGELPRQYERDFEIMFETDVSTVIENENVRYQHSDGQLFIIFSSSKLQVADAFVVLEYSDAAISPSRRKRSFSNPTMRSRTLAPKVWNAATLSWDVNPNLQLSGISSTGKAQFKSNFFGTFAVSEVIIAPTPIDFNRLFLNFATYLRDSPYVLAVNCFFITMTIIIALILRRADTVDRDLWKYYPLVDNSESGRYIYTISLHTSIRSAGNLTATPFFILIGSEGRPTSRLLSDGCRKNFRPGSVSNFYLTSDVDIGAVKQIKLWHDNEGKSTNWHMDRIIVNDMQNLSKYVFLCQKWLSLEKEDGRLCRTFTAFTEDDKPDLLDIVAKQKLFDDHLWLSLVKRPTFSRFTRVQRFLCAVAMLFLSMITSAMWYEDYDSASKQSSGLEIGPISLNIRQLFVGVMSSVIIVIPGIIMTIAFKRRKFKGEVIKEQTGCCSFFGYFSGKKLFPWWFIFIGYFLVVAAVGASAFFTFMYSLQWGGITSLNWLMSLVFSTSGSTGLVEPVKIIVLAVALSSVFKKSAKEDIASVAPLQLEKMNVIGQVKTREIPEPPDDNCEDIVKRRHQLFQKTKLVNIGKSLLAKLALVGLLLVICLHSEVLDSYRLNTFVRTYAAESFISKNVGQRGDVWVWLNSTFIPSMIPKYKYNNDLMPVYDQRFASDGSNIRMGPISLRQYRVVDSCEHNILTRRYQMPMLCTPEYKASTAEINTFKEGWTSCHNTTCAEVPFRLTLSSGGSTVDTEGTFATYGDGSYIESWDEDQTYALSRSTFLSYNDWLDINSRALIVESSLYNPNVALFTRLQVLFEFPTIGGVTYNVDVKSAKLYPYTTVWDYLVLLLQIVFMLTVLVRLCMFFRSVLCCKKKMDSGSAVVFGIEMLLSLTAMAVYGVKIDRTIFTVEELHNNPDSYVSFDLVFLLEDVFRFTLSMTLFIRILHLLEPLTFSHSLFVFRSTVIAARRELLSFTIVLLFVVTAFACFFYLLEGPVTYDIRSMGVMYLTLFQTLLGMVKSSQFQFQETGLELYVKQYAFVIFFFSATLILVNIAIIILSTDLSAMQGHKDFSVGPGYDQELNDYFWEIVSTFLKKFTIQSKQEIEEEKAKLDSIDHYPILEKTSKIQDKLDEIMCKLSVNNDEDLSIAAQLAKKAFLGLYGVSNSTVRDLTEVKVESVDRAALYADSSMEAMPSPRLVKEMDPEVTKRVFYARRASIEPNTISISLNDAAGTGSMTISEFGSRQLTKEPIQIQDVTEAENSKIQHASLILFGKVFRLNSSVKDQGFNIKIVFLLSKHPRAYEKLSIAVKGQGSTQWTRLTSTSDLGNVNNPYTTVTAFNDYLPEHMACVSDKRIFKQLITPSGVEFSLPFEPRSKITFDKGCVPSECAVTFTLIPHRPYPVMQISHNGSVQLPVKVQLPAIYPEGDNEDEDDPIVITSMADKKWWIVPSRTQMDDAVVTFNANLAPTNIKVAYCVKLSEIEQVKRGNSDKPDFLSSDTLCGICRMINESWGDLANALGMQQPHIYMMMTNLQSQIPVNPCRHMLTLWNKQLPVAADRMRYMKAALRKIKRFDVIEWIDNHEETPRPSSKQKDLNKLKAFNTVIRHPIVCENWLRLAEACCLHQEEITLIDTDVPRTDAEKAFLVLSKWSEKYPIFNVAPLQKILMLAGYPHIAHKTMDSPTESRRRFSRIGRTASKATLLYK